MVRLLGQTTPPRLRFPSAWASHDPVASFPLFFLLTLLDRYTHNSFGFGNVLTRSSSHHSFVYVKLACRFFILLTHKLRGKIVHLPPNTSHLLTGSMTKRQSVWFLLPFSGQTDMAAWSNWRENAVHLLTLYQKQRIYFSGQFGDAQSHFFWSIMISGIGGWGLTCWLQFCTCIPVL